jgi:triacylglycerol lipase
MNKDKSPQKSLNERLIHPPVNRAAYSDRTAWILANCSKMAYHKIPQLKAGLKKFDLKLVNQFYCDQNQNFAYLAVHETYAVLAFKGTVPNEIHTVETDADFWQVQSKYGAVHQGFLDTYRELAKEIEPVLRKIDLPIYITGHSLGGALALLATVFLADQDKLAACYNYGCPRVGTDPMADRIFKVPVYRCVHHADIVPAVPLLIQGYRQYGDTRYLRDNGKVCEGSQAFVRRFFAVLNPLNWLHCISDHGIENYVRILDEYAKLRNR